jgi:hypothetical protein
LPARDEFLRLIWDDIINAPITGKWIENSIVEAKARPKGPFADTGVACERLLAAGAARRDLSLVARAAAYEAVFSLLYMLGDPGLDEENGSLLHESLLSADPSGLDGRPGSAP